MPRIFDEQLESTKVYVNSMIDAALHNQAKTEARRRRRKTGRSVKVAEIYEEALEQYFRTIERRKRA